MNTHLNVNEHQKNRTEIEMEIRAAIKQKKSVFLIDCVDWWRSFPGLDELVIPERINSGLLAAIWCEVGGRIEEIAKYGKIANPQMLPWLIVIDTPEHLPQEEEWNKLFHRIEANSPEIQIEIIEYDERPFPERRKTYLADLL
jgi:hypothetical protein